MTTTGTYESFQPQREGPRMTLGAFFVPILGLYTNAPRLTQISGTKKWCGLNPSYQTLPDVVIWSG